MAWLAGPAVARRAVLGVKKKIHLINKLGPGFKGKLAGWVRV